MKDDAVSDQSVDLGFADAEFSHDVDGVVTNDERWSGDSCGCFGKSPHVGEVVETSDLSLLHRGDEPGVTELRVVEEAQAEVFVFDFARDSSTVEYIEPFGCGTGAEGCAQFCDRICIGK